jgi:hypothetical protein
LYLRLQIVKSEKVRKVSRHISEAYMYHLVRCRYFEDGGESFKWTLTSDL